MLQFKHRIIFLLKPDKRFLLIKSNQDLFTPKLKTASSTELNNVSTLKAPVISSIFFASSLAQAIRKSPPSLETVLNAITMVPRKVESRKYVSLRFIIIFLHPASMLLKRKFLKSSDSITVALLIFSLITNTSPIVSFVKLMVFALFCSGINLTNLD